MLKTTLILIVILVLLAPSTAYAKGCKHNSENCGVVTPPTPHKPHNYGLLFQNNVGCGQPPQPAAIRHMCAELTPHFASVPNLKGRLVLDFFADAIYTVQVDKTVHDGNLTTYDGHIIGHKGSFEILRTNHAYNVWAKIDGRLFAATVDVPGYGGYFIQELNPAGPF